MQQITLHKIADVARGWLSNLRRHHRWPRNKEKKLRLCETIPLGEKRFVAVVQFEQERFLVGGTGHSIALLAHLPGHAAGDGLRRGRRTK